jgi:Predicted phosphoesterases, related to the Icc protein
MRILCVSDQVDPLVYSPRMRDRFKDVDLVLSAGDLPSEYLGFITSMLNVDMVYVAGNHDMDMLEARGLSRWGGDTEESIAKATGAIDAGFRVRRVGDLIILGLPGSILYNKGPNQYSELSMKLRIWRLVPRLVLNKLLYGRAVDLVLTHAAPLGIHDKDDPCHRGFECFLWLMRRYKPRWLIHGHIHLYDLADVRVSQYCETTVINAFGHWILDTEA